MATVYTIGHSNHSISRFLELLAMHDITCVADVRSVPLSRFHPQFNKDRLSDSLKGQNIQYAFLGDVLGGRIKDQACYLSRTLPDRKIHIAELVDYSVLVQKPWFLAGISSLKKLAEEHRVAVMCSEEDQGRCHRNLLIARKLAEDGFSILHIRSDGRCEKGDFGHCYEQMTME